jgi:hypothetical protein
MKRTLVFTGVVLVMLALASGFPVMSIGRTGQIIKKQFAFQSEH